MTVSKILKEIKKHTFELVERWQFTFHISFLYKLNTKPKMVLRDCNKISLIHKHDKAMEVYFSKAYSSLTDIRKLKGL